MSKVRREEITKDEVKQMRDWAKDCLWGDLEADDIDELTDVQVINGVAANYAGGLAQFLKDCRV